MTTYQEELATALIDRLTSQRDQARRDRDLFAQVMEDLVKELDESRATMGGALASLAASDATMEMASSSAVAKDATIGRLGGIISAQVDVIDEREATIARVKAVVDDWGAGTVHRPRSPYYARLRAALEETP